MPALSASIAPSFVQSAQPKHHPKGVIHAARMM
jgi:hypothetical protein